MRIFLACGMIIFSLIPAYAGELSRIELTDGSTINAEVISLNNGVYTLDAKSLGTIEVPVSQITRIESAAAEELPQYDAPPAPTDTTHLAPPWEKNSVPTRSSAQSEIQRVQTKLMANPEAVKMTMDLANDPGFQELMKDPEIVAAVKSGNMQSLMENPKFMDMMNNRKIGEIKEKLGE